MGDFPYTKEQLTAIHGTANRMIGGCEEVTVAGLAGTGKSAMIPALFEELSKTFKQVYTLTPTGKAALVLRNKGIPAKTIHSMAYSYVGYDDVEEQPIFVHKNNGKFACAIIVDEASMVSKDAKENLCARGFPVCWVGDPFQLPPVKSQSTGIFDCPDYELSKIHRQQGKDNPIVLFAHAIRNGEASIANDWDGIEHIDSLSLTNEKIAEYCLENKVERLLTWRNRQRVRLNQGFRNVLGHSGIVSPGEEIICLANDRDNGIYNGQIFRVVHVEPMGEYLSLSIRELEIPDSKIITVYADPEQFGAENTLPREDDGLCLFDYAYAMTCHKAQGSQWESVGVIGASFDPRWQYTAVTRAKSRVFVFS